MQKKLTKEASHAELAELELSLRSDPDLHYSLQAVTDFWESHPSIQQKFAERAFDEHIARMRALGIDFSETAPLPTPPTATTRFFFSVTRKRLMSVAVLILLAAGFSVYNKYHVTGAPVNPPEKNISEVSTLYGSKTNLLLPDGSSVMLNAGSRLTYDSSYGRKIREVTLSGEGFFDVVKNPEKPFVIHTGKINIRVLGTAFNVRSYPGEKTIETSLIRGSIEVTFTNRPKQKVILKPNQKLVVKSEEASERMDTESPADKKEKPVPVVIDRLTHFGPDSLIAETAWVQNKLVFQDKSFPEVAEMMQRWYGIDIRLNDSLLQKFHFTGSFENESIQQALSALQLSTRFIYEMHNKQVEIYNTK